MLVSLPFLTGATDDDASGDTLGEVTGQGAFPLSSQFGWHGGQHFQAPGNPDSPESVRAMADGSVVFARASDPIPDHADDPAVLEANPLLYYKGWTSNGVVILRHDTEIGEGVRVTFYSIYQHMHTLVTHTVTTRKKDAHGHWHSTTQEVPLARGDKVYRKDSIGTAGAIYGQPNRIHVEIIADEANVAALMGRSQGPLAQTRTTSVWGESHIVVPAGTPYYDKDPRDARLTYAVRAFNPATPPAGHETLASIAAQFATTPARLNEINKDLIARLRTQYPGLNNWLDAVTGVWQHNRNLPPPNNRNITVPPVWGDGPQSVAVPPEVWAQWQLRPLGRTTGRFMISLAESQGTFTLTTRDTTGKALWKATEGSYDLYDRARKEFPGCPSAGSELLRLGRVLGPEALAVSDQYRGHVPHLRKVRIDGNEVFIDLNAQGIRVHSDADFPDWQGWTFIDDDTDGNSRCDSQKLIELILAQLPPTESPAASQEAQAAPVATPAAQPSAADDRARQRLRRAYLGTHEARVRERLKRCVVKMPTEWARDDFEQRWGWVQLPMGSIPASVLLPMCLSPQAYQKFRLHHAKLSFWEDAQAAGLQLDKVHYHFHPRLFVETFRRCGWLSESELVQMLPMSALRRAGSGWVSEAVTYPATAERNVQRTRDALNKALRKYGISSSRLRMAAFFGNATEETQWFQKLHEEALTQRYYPWDGRGFLQLTWPANYFRYWEFRGRQIDKSLKDEMDRAQREANSTGTNAPLQDSRHPGLTAQMRQWREDVHDTLFPDPSDSAGAYWAWTSAAQFADQQPMFQRRTQNVNHTAHVYYSCESFGQVAATVNFGSPTTNASSIANVNGIVMRYQAYVNALFVLDDYRLFPRAQGQNELPEGFERRKV
ncbi:conserved hypothetical protein [Paraburkholderia tropica]|uniref:M23 family metallopeptidase n=1 Tax=Paraburkholderia tropica TaxID=92647 RepID=UPI001CAA8C94|nr:M23 family metallopeptidase [Paraburkholderia tropica]CAG9232789.1 conserved hypothetical protein [Paraburkholderia tropica]